MSPTDNCAPKEKNRVKEQVRKWPQIDEIEKKKKKRSELMMMCLSKMDRN
jgi:hypothetical protein